MQNVITVLLLDETRVPDLVDELRFTDAFDLCTAWGSAERERMTGLAAMGTCALSQRRHHGPAARVFSSSKRRDEQLWC